MKKLNLRKLTPVQSYVAGFVFSVILTLIPYYIVVEEKLSGDALLFGLMGYAVLQLFVQLVFFLHLAEEKKPRWNLLSIIFVMSIVLFIGIGTLWIMKNLNYHMINTPSSEIEEKLLKDQNYHPNNQH